jgi:hypothetical protein
MLKKKQFIIQQEDEADFEAFLTKLNHKRKHDRKEEVVRTIRLDADTEPHRESPEQSIVVERHELAEIAETTMESFYSSNFDAKPEIPPQEPPKKPSTEARQILR